MTAPWDVVARVVAKAIAETTEPTEPRPFDEVADAIVAQVRRPR